MKAEQQYIDLFTQYEDLICRKSVPVLNALRAQAFADFERLGFPSLKGEDYKYTDVEKAFAPDYGININRLDIPVNPYDVFHCDVPNLSTSLYLWSTILSMRRNYRRLIYPKVSMWEVCVALRLSIRKWRHAIMASWRRLQPME